jgi:hypothetical protein
VSLLDALIAEHPVCLLDSPQRPLGVLSDLGQHSLRAAFSRHRQSGFSLGRP